MPSGVWRIRSLTNTAAACTATPGARALQNAPHQHRAENIPVPWYAGISGVLTEKYPARRGPRPHSRCRPSERPVTPCDHLRGVRVNRARPARPLFAAATPGGVRQQQCSLGHVGTVRFATAAQGWPIAGTISAPSPLYSRPPSPSTGPPLFKARGPQFRACSTSLAWVGSPDSQSRCSRAAGPAAGNAPAPQNVTGVEA